MRAQGYTIHHHQDLLPIPCLQTYQNAFYAGARLATITVSFPAKSSGAYADLMPAKTCLVSVPISSCRRNNLSAPSTCSALTILAMRRSTFAKSSKLMVGASSSSFFGAGVVSFLVFFLCFRRVFCHCKIFF
jgi:hypothetical protein